MHFMDSWDYIFFQKQEEQKALDNESSSDCALVIKNSRPLENLSHSLLNNVSDLSDEEVIKLFDFG